MKNQLFKNMASVLFITLIVASCNNTKKEKTKEENQKNNTEIVINEHINSNDYCFRNEYPFPDDPKNKDIQELQISINGDIATGFYNWLPVYKDQRKGKISGKFENNIIKGTYTFYQEGVSKTENIEVTLNDAEAIIKGDKKELGLDAKIQKVKCTDEKD